MADLTLKPDYVFTEEVTWETLISTFENSAEQRRSKNATNRKQWKLVFKNRAQADRDTIRTLFDTKKGQALSFTWTNPDDSQDYTVRFLDKKLAFDLKAYNLYDFDFNLIQVK